MTFKTDTKFTKNRIPTVILIDEADYFLIDLTSFKIDQTPFIGLTATTFKEGTTTVEKTFIEKCLKVQIFDSQIPEIIDTTTTPARKTLQEFFENLSTKWPILVYLPESHDDNKVIVSAEDLIEMVENAGYDYNS